MATIGPRTTKGLTSPVKDVNGLVLLGVCSGWYSDCVGVGMKVGVCLINQVCLGATQAKLEGWISSSQPLNSTGREVRA